MTCVRFNKTIISLHRASNSWNRKGKAKEKTNMKITAVFNTFHLQPSSIRTSKIFSSWNNSLGP